RASTRARLSVRFMPPHLAGRRKPLNSSGPSPLGDVERGALFRDPFHAGARTREPRLEEPRTTQDLARLRGERRLEVRDLLRLARVRGERGERARGRWAELLHELVPALDQEGEGRVPALATRELRAEQHDRLVPPHRRIEREREGAGAED